MRNYKSLVIHEGMCMKRRMCNWMRRMRLSLMPGTIRAMSRLVMADEDENSPDRWLRNQVSIIKQANSNTLTFDQHIKNHSSTSPTSTTPSSTSTNYQRRT